MDHDREQDQHLPQEQISLYQELVQSANSIILRWDRQSRIIFMNQYGLDLFGFTEEELIGKEVVGTIVAETDRSGRDLNAMIEDILLHPEKYLLNKNENTCKDGSSLWIQWSNKAIVDSDGTFLEMLSVGINITPQVNVEKKLGQREKLYQAMFEASFDAHFLFKNEKYYAANNAGLALLGCTYGDIAGKPPGLLSPELQPNGIPSREILARICTKVYQGERVEMSWQVKRRNGEIRFTEIKAQCIEPYDEKIIHVSLRDITEQRALREELRQRQKLEAIGTLAGGIAHDFNNILMAIMGYTELVQMKLGRESSVGDELEQIRTASVRAKDLVSQILTFSRKAEQAKQSIQISLVVREALQLLRSSIPSTIEIEEQIEAENFVLADPTQIHQVIVNLCTNASLAMTNERGTLRLSLQDLTVNSHRQSVRPDTNHPAPGNYVVLEVEDTGCGISPEIKNKLFDPYFTTREHGQGSGMGLAVVHGIVQSHHGIITVDSKENHGALFRLYFPAISGIAGPKNSQQEDMDSRRAGSAPLRGNILLADDEASIRELIGDFLTEKGHCVTTCVDGEQALEKFSKTADHWDLVITDQTMPKMTGMQLSVRIQQIQPDLPIILCSGYNRAVDMEISRQLGFHAIIEKPVSLHQLLAEVEKAFISRSATLPQS